MYCFWRQPSFGCRLEAATRLRPKTGAEGWKEINAATAEWTGTEIAAAGIVDGIGTAVNGPAIVIEITVSIAGPRSAIVAIGSKNATTGETALDCHGQSVSLTRDQQISL